VLWVLLSVAVVLVALAVLALAVLSTWRQAVALTKAVGRASDVVAAAGEGLAVPAERTGPAHAARPVAAPPTTPDVERLTARVDESRTAARSWERR
jgi:hypothetical protein